MNFFFKFKFYFNIFLSKILVCLVSFLFVVGLDKLKLKSYSYLIFSIFNSILIIVNKLFEQNIITLL